MFGAFLSRRKLRTEKYQCFMMVQSYQIMQGHLDSYSGVPIMSQIQPLLTKPLAFAITGELKGSSTNKSAKPATA